MASRLYMAASVFIRMGAGLAVFVALARSLGPSGFGFVSTVLAYAALASLLTDFGASLKALREIAAAPEQGGAIIAANLSVKGYLTLVMAVVVTGALVVLPLTPQVRASGALLAAGILMGSMADLALVGFRALGAFGRETWIVGWTSILHIALVIPVALAGGGLLAISLCFVLSRAIYLLVAVWGVVRLFPEEHLRPLGLGASLTSIRRSLAWAVDSGLGYVNGQIDGLLILPILGVAAAGIYQSGARFVQAALAMASILSNVHIAAIAAQPPDRGLSAREVRMIGEFIGLGGFFGLAFWLGGPWLTENLLGPDFAQVDALWPGFAAFLFMRYAAAAFGAALAAIGRPAIRVIGQAVGTALILLGFWLVLPRVGLAATPWIMMAGAAATLLLYAGGRLNWLRTG